MKKKQGKTCTIKSYARSVIKVIQIVNAMVKSLAELSYRNNQVSYTTSAIVLHYRKLFIGLRRKPDSCVQ